MTALPWAELDAAHEQLEAADRSGDPDEIHRAWERWEAAHDECGRVGTMLFMHAIEFGTLLLQGRLSEIFGGLNRGAWERALAAEQRAAEAMGQVDALKQRLIALEEQLARGTHEDFQEEKTPREWSGVLAPVRCRTP